MEIQRSLLMLILTIYESLGISGAGRDYYFTINIQVVILEATVKLYHRDKNLSAFHFCV